MQTVKISGTLNTRTGLTVRGNGIVVQVWTSILSYITGSGCTSYTEFHAVGKGGKKQGMGERKRGMNKEGNRQKSALITYADP
jgi:hypothetical protein